MCRALEKVKRPGTFLLGGTYHAKTTSSRLAVRRTADARPGVLEEQLNSLYREAERRGYTVVNGGAEHRCAGDLDRPALFAMLAAVRGGRVDAVMLTRLSRFSYHRLALYLILCFLQDHGVGLITTEYELRYILYLRGFERTLLDRAQENGCNALWAEGE